jgi:predicted ATPase
MQKRRLPKPSRKNCRVVLTGGPGGGKTTAADLFRREIGDRVVIVPEAATILFQGGFPRSRAGEALQAAQTTIFHVQRNLEDVQGALYPGRVLLCDRGTIDGAAYWPGDSADYFKAVGTSLEAELQRYDAVIFFETAAVGGASIEGGNPMRSESIAEAVQLDKRLRALWCQHPRFILVPHNASFFKKISFGLAALEGIVAQLREDSDPFDRGIAIRSNDRSSRQQIEPTAKKRGMRGRTAR